MDSNIEINKDNNIENKELSTLKALALGTGLGALNIASTAGGIITGTAVVLGLTLPSVAPLLLDPLVDVTESIIGVQLDDFTPWEEQVYCAYGPAYEPEHAEDVIGFQ